MGNEHTIIDVNQETSIEQLTSDIQASIAESITESDTSEVAKPAQSDKPDWIEDKFWTGDTAESAAKQHDAYTSLQSAYGRMANDLGTQRKLTDQLLELKRDEDLTQNTPKPQTQIDGVELLDNPNDTLDSYITPRLEESTAELKARLAKMEADLAQKAFTERHPEAGTMGNDPKFVEWVNASPYRAQRGAAAASGDYGAADELLSEYKERLPATPVDNSDDAALAEAKKVALESNTSTGDTKSGKVYSRASLIQLKLRDPATYESPDFQAEIVRAYAEGRVK